MLILYAVQALTPRYGQGAGAIAIELYALHNVLYAVGSYPVGALDDRYGKRAFLLAAYTLGALMNLILIVGRRRLSRSSSSSSWPGRSMRFTSRSNGRLRRTSRRSKSGAPVLACSRPPTASAISCRARLSEHCGRRFRPKSLSPMRSS